MFTRVDNVNAFWEPDLSALVTRTGRLYLHIGEYKYPVGERVPRSAVKRRRQRSSTEPVFYGAVKGLNYWRFDNHWFTEDDDLSAGEVEALARSYDTASAQRARGAEATANDRAADGPPRETVGDDVRQRVWQRDAGKCQRCGGTQDLQFDHVIPVSLGGATSVDNLQVLCTRCSQLKGTAAP